MRGRRTTVAAFGLFAVVLAEIATAVVGGVAVGYGAGHRSGEQADGHDDQGSEVGGDAEQGHLRDGGELEDHGDDAEDPQPDGHGDAHGQGTCAVSSGAVFGRVRIWTKSSLRTSAKGRTWTRW